MISCMASTPILNINKQDERYTCNNTVILTIIIFLPVRMYISGLVIAISNSSSKIDFLQQIQWLGSEQYF
jgi:hypothetical protein